MTVAEMRAYISDAYPGRSWKARCTVMNSQQVIAIYHSLIEREKAKPKNPIRKNSKKVGYQFTIFDLLKEE